MFVTWKLISGSWYFLYEIWIKKKKIKNKKKRENWRNISNKYFPFIENKKLLLWKKLLFIRKRSKKRKKFKTLKYERWYIKMTYKDDIDFWITYT